LPSTEEEKNRGSSDGNHLKARTDEFLTDLQEAIPKVTPRNIKNLLIVVAIFSACLCLFAVILHFIPLERFKSFGYLGVFLANLLSSMGVFMPVPPGIPVSVVVYSVDTSAANLIWVALLTSVGSTLGELTAYYVGYGGEHFLKLKRFSRYKTVEKWMNRYGGLAVFTFAALPLFIFDLVGIVAGTLRFPVKKFILFCYLGRLPRAFIEIYFYTWAFENIVPHLPGWMSAHFAG